MLGAKIGTKARGWVGAEVQNKLTSSSSSSWASSNAYLAFSYHWFTVVIANISRQT